jgi:hypothetical protein
VLLSVTVVWWEACFGVYSSLKISLSNALDNIRIDIPFEPGETAKRTLCRLHFRYDIDRAHNNWWMGAGVAIGLMTLL